MGYRILTSKLTKTYYMQPYKVLFYVFSEETEIDLSLYPVSKDEEIIVIDTEINDMNELDTMLYNAGYHKGYIDGNMHILSTPNIKYAQVNANDIYYAQYILTQDKSFLDWIDYDQLYSLLQISQNNQIFHPQIKDEIGIKILVYTNPYIIDDGLKTRYKNFQICKIAHLTDKKRNYLINNTITVRH